MVAPRVGPSNALRAPREASRAKAWGAWTANVGYRAFTEKPTEMVDAVPTFDRRLGQGEHGIVSSAKSLLEVLGARTEGDSRRRGVRVKLTGTPVPVLQQGA